MVRHRAQGGVVDTLQALKQDLARRAQIPGREIAAMRRSNDWVRIDFHEEQEEEEQEEEHRLFIGHQAQTLVKHHEAVSRAILARATTAGAARL